jgi:uncharacterized membrane protein YjfL (UPF0719 family)
MYISVLSLGPRGWIQIVNFIAFGTLFLVFSCGIATEFRVKKASRVGPMLFVIIAICLFFSGPFVMDPMANFSDQMTWHGIIHNILGVIVFLLSPVSCFVFLRHFRKDSNLQSLRSWTFAAGMIITGAVVVLAIAQKSAIVAPNALTDWAGFIQRIALITYLCWLFTFALVFRKQIKRDNR